MWCKKNIALGNCPASLTRLESITVRLALRFPLYLVYLRLVVLTAGTLLPFFWIVVILGHRRQRNFERVFFFLCLALVFLFGGSLLALNAELFYETPPRVLTSFAWTVVCIGVLTLPSLIISLHVEYAEII